MTKTQQTILAIILLRKIGLQKTLEIEHKELPLTFMFRIMSVFNQEDKELLEECHKLITPDLFGINDITELINEIKEIK